MDEVGNFMTYSFKGSWEKAAKYLIEGLLKTQSCLESVEVIQRIL